MALGSSLIQDHDVYVLTARGEQELRGAGTSLSPADIELLVRTDGISTIAQIKASVRSMAADAVAEKLQRLVRDGLIAAATHPRASDSLDIPDFFSAATHHQPSAQVMTRARAEASDGLATLRKQGYYVRIARRPALKRQLTPDERVSVIVVEDEPNLAKFLKQYLAFEGYEVKLAANRAEVMEAFRQVRTPSLVLLDVMLPDADGFDILLKMREHPVLKSVPVIMLTATATREAVLKGLARGANGYVTKPFEADTLVEAVKTVLGLA